MSRICALLLLGLITLSYCNNVKAQELRAGKVNPWEVYTYEKLTKDVIELKRAFPEQIHLYTLGETGFGKQIWAVRLGHGKKSVLLNGSHHGREWISTNLLMEMLDCYAVAFKNKQPIFGHSSSLLDEVSLWVIPMVNPDGVTIQQSGVTNLPFALKEVIVDMNKGSHDFTRWKANGFGVDLNRQYQAGWTNLEGVEKFASYKLFKGSKPMKEEEVKALVHFTKSVKPVIAVSYHTSGEEIYWHYNTPREHVRRDLSIAKKVSFVTGYPLAKPPKIATGGGYTDWFIQTYQRPAMTIELCPLVEETSPALSTFADVWKRNRTVGILLAALAKEM